MGVMGMRVEHDGDEEVTEDVLLHVLDEALVAMTDAELPSW